MPRTPPAFLPSPPLPSPRPASLPRARTRCAAAPRQAPASLHTPASLHALLVSPAPPTVFDVRGRVEKPGGRVAAGWQPTRYRADEPAYRAAHIPRASFLDWRAIDLLAPAALRDTLSRRAVRTDTPVVLYDCGDMLFAARAWWALRALGLRHVSLLDAGWAAWRAAGLPVSRAAPPPPPPPPGARAPSRSPRRAREPPRETVPLREMRDVVARARATVVDARSRRLYDGVERRTARAGHIPGAVNVPYRRLLREGGTGLRGVDEMAAVFEEAGVRGDRDVVAYCNGGVASSLVLFCLVRCGFPVERLRNYCGSFGEWGELDDTPVEVS